MFKLEIDTGNAAFDNDGEGDCHGEVARILRDLADKIEGGHGHGNLHDINGNRVGNFTLTTGD